MTRIAADGLEIRNILLAQGPDTSIGNMRSWTAKFDYRDGIPVPGITAEKSAGPTMPILVLSRDRSDMAHTRGTSVAARRGRFERWPLIAPDVLNFLQGRSPAIRKD